MGGAGLFEPLLFPASRARPVEGRRSLPEDSGRIGPEVSRNRGAAPRWPAVYHQHRPPCEGPHAREPRRDAAEVLPAFEAGGGVGRSLAPARYGRSPSRRRHRVACAGAAGAAVSVRGAAFAIGRRYRAGGSTRWTRAPPLPPSRPPPPTRPSPPPRPPSPP